MAVLTNGVRACGGPVSRRSFLQAGTLALGGLGMSDLLRLRASAAEANGASEPDTSVIFIWLPGGPSHLETYDMKPNAPSEYRGLFNPRRTNVPGMQVCELLPLHAQCADKYNIIRSVSHEFADHGGGHKRFLTGYKPKLPTGTIVDNPMVGSVVSKMREKVARGIPNYICEVDAGRQGIDVFAFGPAYLSASTTPFFVVGDPSEPTFKVENLGLTHEMADRLGDRETLLKGLDRLHRNIDASGMMDSMDKFNQNAVSMLTSDKAKNAFDLSRESERTRERYGNHRFGQRALMARRLVEAGVSFVTVVMENPGGEMPKNCTYNWDSHAVNCHMYDDARWRYPYYDQAVTALIEDLYARGLNKKVMLVATGEFGRTPKLNTTIGSQTGVTQPGRDHWASAMSMIVSGGGMRTGQVIGATNSKGEYPVQRPLKPEDLWATVYRHLGIDYTQALYDHTGRPTPILPEAKPISEILPVT